MNLFSIRKLCLRILVSLIAAVTLVFLYGCFNPQSVLLNSHSKGLMANLESAIFMAQYTGNIPLSQVGFPSCNSTNASPVDKMTIRPVQKLLGVASSITIVSLPDRKDRRQDMEALRRWLGLPCSEWSYADAVGSADKRIRLVMEWVQFVRSTLSNHDAEGIARYRSTHQGEKDIERLVKSEVYLDIWHTGPWPSPFSSGFTTGLNTTDDLSAIGSATKDANFPTSLEAKHFPNHKLLTPPRVACWYSHLEVIHKIANTPIHMGQGELAYLVLEDDVDMETDIQGQIKLLWGYLPEDWDIVFLGHCWSNESFHPALTPEKYPPLLHALHPSRRPKCTHAYALSRTGARRILLHLRHPPFAFSRAIDQAFGWLIESRKVKGAFSIVPSLVVQRKVRDSDVFPGRGGKGSGWKEKLRKGVLDG